ncbi:MAG: chemotaxis protein CheW [candidate division WOR-3 bacterium]
METLIIFKIGDELVGIDIRKVREVTELPPFVPVPHAPNFILGLANIRGEIVPIISLRQRLGITGEEQSNMILVIEEEERIAGLRVDGLWGTKKIDSHLINRNSELLVTRKERDFFVGAYEGEEKPILILNLSRVIAREE